MATLVTPESYSDSCTEIWVDPDDLDTEDAVVAERAAIDATWALWSLTGERFHGKQCWVEDYRTIPGYCTIQLRQFPVAQIASVSRVDLCSDAVLSTGVGTVISGWCHEGGDKLKVCCSGSSGGAGFYGSWHHPGFAYGYGSNYGVGRGCGCSNRSVVRVHYTVGNNLPSGAPHAAKRLAQEYVKASQGQKCSLPERITNVNRQGASWTILDPQDFLDDGLTGIGPVDQWLAQVGLRSRWASMTDPLRSVPLANSTLVGCGEEDCFSDLSS